MPYPHPRVPYSTLLTVLVGLSACEGTIGGGGAQGTGPVAGASSLGGTAGPTASGGMPAALGAGEGCLPSRRLRKLSPDQVDATVRALGINAPPAAQRLRDTLSLSDATFSSYAARLDLSQPHVSELFDAAKSIATAAVAAGGPAESCMLPAAEADCVTGFLTTFGRAAFRRPLTAGELTTFTSFFSEQRQLDDAATSMASLLRTLFMSPSFLYRTELGELRDDGGIVPMTAYEVASAIAYYLSDAPPDAILMAAAERGELATAAGRGPQVRRLLMTQGLAPGLSRFFGEYFRTAAVGSVSARDTTLYPDFNSDIARDFGSETQSFFAEVMLNDDARLSTLLTAPYVMVTALTAPFYGISGVTSSTPTRMTPPANQRSGILTQASWLTRFAHDKEGNPVSRGRFVRERLLCDSVPPAPPTVNAVPPPPDGQRQHRERLKSHVADPTCAGCHALMDPIGLSFENYDAVGRYRATELDQPIDATGSTQDASGASYEFSDGRDLSRQLAVSPVVDACFSKQVFLYAQGMAGDEAGNCAFKTLATRLQAAGGNVIEMIVASVSSDEFFMRIKEAP